MSVILIPVPHCVNCCSFVLSFEVAIYYFLHFLKFNELFQKDYLFLKELHRLVEVHNSFGIPKFKNSEDANVLHNQIWGPKPNLIRTHLAENAICTQCESIDFMRPMKI